MLIVYESVSMNVIAHEKSCKSNKFINLFSPDMKGSLRAISFVVFTLMPRLLALHQASCFSTFSLYSDSSLQDF